MRLETELLDLGTRIKFRGQLGWIQGRSFVKPFRYNVLLDDQSTHPDREIEDLEVISES